MIGKDGEVLANSMVSFDTRNLDTVQWLQENRDVKRYGRITGVPLHTMFSMTKLLYIRDHEPELYERTDRVMTFGDFVAYKLCGQAAMDASSASRTMMFHVREGRWEQSIIEEVGLDPGKLPRVVPCGTLLGPVRGSAAAGLGLSAETVVAAGGHDQVCCALGAGILESGIAMNSMGTTDSILCVCKEFSASDTLLDANIPCGAYSLEKLYACHSFVLSTGSIVQWFKKTYFKPGDISFKELDAYMATHPEPGDLQILPHFSGSGTPWMDSCSKGVIAGLTLETTNMDIYHGILEGICYELRTNLDNMQAVGLPVDQVICIGGASGSRPYLQLKANIYQKPIVRQNVAEAGCLGAALLGAKAAGLIGDMGEALKNFISEDEVILPDSEMAALYEEKFQTYRRLYGISRELFGKQSVRGGKPGC